MADDELMVSVLPEAEQYTELLETTQQLTHTQVQLESLLGATDSLEALCRHLDQHGVVSDVHRQALTLSLEHLAPLDADLWVDYTVSTESLKDRLRDLWKRLVALVLSLLASIKRYWLKVSTFRGQLRLSAEILYKRAGARRLATVRQPSLELGMEIKTFVVGESLVTDPDALIRSISAALDQYKLVTTLYGKRMLAIGREFEALLTAGGSGHDKLVATNKLFDTLPMQEIASKTRALVYRDPRFGKRLTLVAPPTIGGWSLFFLMLEQAQMDKRTSDPIGYAQALRTTGVKFALTNVNISNFTSGTVKTASGLQIQALAKRVLDILDLIEAQEKVMVTQRLLTQTKAVLRAGERYQQGLGGDATLYDENVMRFVRNYSAWAFGPIDQMTTNLLTVSRNLLTYGRKSLATQTL